MKGIENNLKNKMYLLKAIEESREKISNKGLSKLDKFIFELRNNLNDEIKSLKAMRKGFDLNLLRNFSECGKKYRNFESTDKLINLIKEELEIMQDLISKFNREKDMGLRILEGLKRW